jgi:hypothetical protein
MNSENKFFHSPDKPNANETKALSVYGMEKFPPENAKQYIDWIANNFKEHFSSAGYKEEQSVPISSGFDPSVRFIGSPISVYKPYLISRQIPNPGMYMRQDCIRTKNLDRLLDDDFLPAWGSYFPNMGAITPPERANNGCNEAFDFFEKKLGISPDNILIRISSLDKDLIEICRGRYQDANFEVDGRSPDYYRHELGIENYGGRNCNIALRNANGEGFSDVANLIIIEDNGVPVCLEISIGTTTILKELHGLDHVQDGVPVGGLRTVDEKFRRKFEDAIVTSSVLFHEGLRPFGQHNRNRILKRYVQALSYFRAKCDIALPDLQKIISDFEKREFGDGDNILSAALVDYIIAFENELKNKKDLTPDQEKIKQVLSLK